MSSVALTPWTSSPNAWAGIEPEFRNAKGEIVRTGAETKRSPLAAMGVRASDEAQTREALVTLERGEWLRPLPPVAVLQADAGPPSVDLVLPVGTGEITWCLTLEDGSEQTGRLDFANLDPLDAHTGEGRQLQRRRLALAAELPCGYHRLAVEPGNSSTVLASTPGKCWLPPPLAQGRRLWGIAAQLYLLRSATDWGIGDFRDLRRLVELAADHGTDVIGLNPLHAMFPTIRNTPVPTRRPVVCCSTSSTLT